MLAVVGFYALSRRRRIGRESPPILLLLCYRRETVRLRLIQLCTHERGKSQEHEQWPRHPRKIPPLVPLRTPAVGYRLLAGRL